jgi:phosphate uptake regulator
MKRKVVKHGPSTLIISLPSKWAKKYNVVKGTELDVLEQEKTLLVSAADGQEGKFLEANIDISSLDRTSVMYIIRSLYRLGYDTVNVRFDKQLTDYQRTGKTLTILSVIHTEVNRLIGFEIIQEREKSCTIKHLETASMKDFDQVLRRIFLLLVDTCNDFLDGVKTNNTTVLETIEERHDTITKFVSYCLRLLNKKGHPVPLKTPYYYHIIAELDRITDIIKYASRDARRCNKKLSNRTLVILEHVAQSLKVYEDLFYKYDNRKIREINNTRYKAEELLRTLPSSLHTLELIVATNMYHILEVLLDLIEARTALEF